jgi:hypothetical protein
MQTMRGIEFLTVTVDGDVRVNQIFPMLVNHMIYELDPDMIFSRLELLYHRARNRHVESKGWGERDMVRSELYIFPLQSYEI